MSTPELEKLAEMLQQGKITPEQYEELRKALENAASARMSQERPAAPPLSTYTPPPRPPHMSPSTDSECPPERPWQIWVVGVILIFAGISQLLIALTSSGRNGAGLALAGVVDMVLGGGVLTYSSLAFGCLVIGGLVAVLVQLSRGNILAALINAAILAILFSAQRYFIGDLHPDSREDSSDTYSHKDW